MIFIIKWIVILVNLWRLSQTTNADNHFLDHSETNFDFEDENMMFGNDQYQGEHQNESTTAMFEQRFIDKINSAQSFWKAGPMSSVDNRTNQSLSMDQFLMMRSGTTLESFSNLTLVSHDFDDTDRSSSNQKRKIPRHFDARKRWPRCTHIGLVRNQGGCGSCWAVAAASTISDRICIASRGKYNVAISAIDLNCCRKCAKQFCGGGSIVNAWKHFQTKGLVTGGEGQNKGCKPYRIKDATKCKRYCTNRKHRLAYKKDRFFGRSVYRIRKNPKQIQLEIMKHGPVTAVLIVYRELGYYKKGVYRRFRNHKKIGPHAVKLIGWGVQRGTPYWLVSNSWGKRWGDKGMFRIRRGTNECGIENYVFAGLA